MAFFAEKPAKKLDKSSLVEPVVTGTNIKQVGTHFLSRGSSPAFLDAYWVVGLFRLLVIGKRQPENLHSIFFGKVLGGNR